MNIKYSKHVNINIIYIYVICISLFMVDLTAIDWRDLHGFAPCLKHNGWWTIGNVNPRTNNLISGHVTPSQIGVYP